MGASTNPKAARLASLQDRRQSIEESLAKRNEELRQLCIKEAELTGSIPSEIPLVPGESPPIQRRCIGTSYQLSENLINLFYNDDESLNTLELNMQIQANLAEAALGLANESSITKTIRRQHMVEYQHHKRQFNMLEEKLSFLKAHTQMAEHNNMAVQQQQSKQKKKPRPLFQGDSVSLNVNMQQHEPFENLSLRHSMRSLQHPLSSGISNNKEPCSYQKQTYRNSDSAVCRPDDSMVSGIYRLSLNGYKTYMERKENNHITGNGQVHSHYYQSQHNHNFYQKQFSFLQMANQVLPLSSQRSQHSRPSYMLYNTNLNTQPVHEYTKCSLSDSPKSLMKLSESCESKTPTYSKSSANTSTLVTHCKQYPYVEQQFTSTNPLQIQPHQIYEHDIMTSGLGGYWKKTDSGELVWCNSVPSESWNCDKRFGSLDRRRNRIQKRTSPLVDHKSATISVMIAYPEFARPTHSKPLQIPNRNLREMRQLVRTQSLGSFGAQTMDNHWSTDDNSSCGSDAHSTNENNYSNKKQKQWFETSLDGPPQLISSRSQSTVPSITGTVTLISPDEENVENSSPHKQLKEIPAQSKPTSSPTIQEPNMEFFNNNIPRNGTLIQAGQCKPYHEETKPFEMSDFYKYSTKFKKFSNQDSPNTESSLSLPSKQQNENKSNDALNITQKGIYQPLQSLRCQNLESNSFENMGTNLENMGSLEIIKHPINQTAVSISDNFTAELNVWYQNQDDNNNPRVSATNNKSTATLV